MPPVLPALGFLLFGYLLGSIPFGLLLTRAAGLGDIREVGSGNIGATNVLRTGRRGLAAATLLLDALKGAIAVLVAAAMAERDASLLAGLGVTRLLQSSTATCLIVASFVGKGLVATSAALVVMLGADVGSSLMWWCSRSTCRGCRRS